MKELVRSLVLLAVLALFAACSPLTSERLADAKAMKPAGSAFQNALWKGYTGYAQEELNENDLSDAERYIDKAGLAAKGQTPAPEDPAKHEFKDPKAAGDLKAAFARMNTAFSANGTQKAPEKAAEAQVAFDCWLEEAEEGFEPTHIAQCRDRFMAAMDTVEASLKVAAPAPPPPPPPEPKLPGPYTIHFPWNKTTLDHNDLDTINQVVADAKAGKASVINITGYTDTSGTPAYNLKLSQKRAEVVAQAIKKAGATAVVATSWVGEDDLAVPTGPNVREPKNRRAVIVLGK